MVIENQVLVHALGHGGRPVSVARQTVQQGNGDAESWQWNSEQARRTAKRRKDANDHLAIRKRFAAGNIIGPVGHIDRLQGCQTRASNVLRVDGLAQAISPSEHREEPEASDTAGNLDNVLVPAQAINQRRPQDYPFDATRCLLYTSRCV